MHWSEAYLRLGYQVGAEGPDLYDCWTFVRLVQDERFGRDVPFMPSPVSRGTTAKVMPAWASSFGWSEVKGAPENGDAAFMANGRVATHVGIYVGDAGEPAILHCPEGGVRLHTFTHLEILGWEVRSYWRPEAR
ncbi:MAG: NlpC/P60 family protein [Reyranella sp.]